MSQAAELLKQLRSLGVQLTLEGDTLRLNAPKGALTPELQSQLRASKADLLDLLRALQSKNSGGIGSPMPRVNRDAPMPLSYAQQRLWFLQQMDPESVANNLLGMLRLDGDLDVDALERALHGVILRHEGLRVCFQQNDGAPFTTITDGLDWRLDISDLVVAEGEPIKDALERFVLASVHQPFDIATGPLLRAYLVRSAADEHYLVLAIHHIVSDGWSMGVLIRELAENYRAFRMNETPQLAELQVQYVDYADWQRKWLDGGVLERQMQYWRKQLAGAPNVVIFPPDHVRSVNTSGTGGRSKRVLSVELTAQLEAFSRANDATLFMTMLAGFMLLLSRYSGLKDVVVGSPSANRNRVELSELIGFFVNNLVLRAELGEGISFVEFLGRVRESTLGAYEHQDTPFDQLVRELSSDRGQEFTPLFQTMFILQNFPMDELRLPGVTVHPQDLNFSSARFDLTAEIYPYHNEFHVYFDYRSDLYDRETIDTLLRDYEHVLAYVIANPNAPLESVPLMPEEARQELLARGNDTSVALPDQSLLLDALQHSVQEYPNKIAVRAGNDSLTYLELHVQSDALARLLSNAGVGKGSLVPVCVQRSTQLLVALLAVLKSGAAYVPLDPIYPSQRIASILDDVKPAALITEQSLQPLLDGYESQCLLLDELSLDITEAKDHTGIFKSASAEDLAYVIFTSGSTGRPKGVEISHGALANFLDSMRKEPGFTQADRILAVTTVSFDIAGLELFLPLYVGGEVILAAAPGDLPTLLEELEREKPTVMQATPALWQMLLGSGWDGDASLTALCGGEALTPQLANTLAPCVKALWNMYGPTETTIWSSALRIDEASGSSVPIGGPIQNTTFYVLDPLREPVPLGVAGELYIGGKGLAHGYLNRPELTADRFIHAPFNHAERLYRTGDLVRRRRDGLIEFLGRADFQVKLRGFRIELGEIEHALRQQPEIAEAVVLLREDSGQKDLVAYLVLKPGQVLTHAVLKQRLREKIPDYMVPAHAVMLDQFPRLPNGKLDRSKLPAPVANAEPIGDSASDDSDWETTTETEAAIARVFRDLLHVNRIGIDQRFFDVGAHSLMLVKAHDRLRRELDPDLRLVSFFQYPSIAALAAHIDQSRAQRAGIAGEIAHAGQR